MDNSQPNESQQSAQAEISDEACCYALECLLKGSKPSDVRRRLLDAGHLPKQVEKTMQIALQYKRDHEAEATQASSEDSGSGNRNMLIGGAVCLIGILITFFSFASASSGGGRFILAWGAIIFGGLQFIRGYLQSQKK
jgi:hypothetical protein